MDLKATVEPFSKSCNFLDIFLDLDNNIYRPYRKENQMPIYINKESNHPPAITKQLPNMISNRLSNLSCSSDIFMSEKPLYQTALKSAGYKEELKYIDSLNLKKKRNRKRKIV